jgi:hypothetical protein
MCVPKPSLNPWGFNGNTIAETLASKILAARVSGSAFPGLELGYEQLLNCITLEET